MNYISVTLQEVQVNQAEEDNFKFYSNVTDNIVDVNVIRIFLRTVFLILLDRIMKKLNTDVIKVLLRFWFWQYLLI